MQMKKLILCLFLLYCESVFCQVQDVETKFYDLFVFSSSNFLIGKEDLRYHPARESLTSNYSMNLEMNYHDLYREWSGGINDKTNYQYDVGLEAKIPFNLFEKNFGLNLDFKKQTFSSIYNSDNNGAKYTGSDWGSYSLNSSLLYDDTSGKLGIRFKYTTGSNSSNLRINQYPEDNTDVLANKYFYSLLEPAFGNDIGFRLTGNEINYALEYNREINSSLNLGFDFYQEINNYDAGINYYSSVEKIEGEKKLSGVLRYNRYTFGLSCEYKLDKFTIRYSAAYSTPLYKLNVNQENLLRQDNVNLEITNLSNGNCNGNGTSAGVGVSYLFNEKISAALSYTLIGNNYTGNLKASTPVLGFEIFPIAHQLNLDFSDLMKNNLFSFEFNQEVNYLWSYSVGIDYLTSNNTIIYNYKILTEFGIGNNKEDETDKLVVDIYKINLETVLNITQSIAVKLLFDQYIPVIQKRGAANIPVQQSPPVSNNQPNKSNWGGSIYSLSIIYNFN